MINGSTNSVGNDYFFVTPRIRGKMCVPFEARDEPKDKKIRMRRQDRRAARSEVGRLLGSWELEQLETRVALDRPEGPQSSDWLVHFNGDMRELRSCGLHEIGPSEEVVDVCLLEDPFRVDDVCLGDDVWKDLAVEHLIDLGLLPNNI